MLYLIALLIKGLFKFCNLLNIEWGVYIMPPFDSSNPDMTKVGFKFSKGKKQYGVVLSRCEME